MRKTRESIDGRPLEFITSQPLLFVATAHSSMNGLALPLCDAYNASRARVQAMQAGLDLRLGDMIRSRRIKLGLTQAEVARQAQISQPALSRIEGGGGVPTLAMLDRLARAMETTFTITVGENAAA